MTESGHIKRGPTASAGLLRFLRAAALLPLRALRVAARCLIVIVIVIVALELFAVTKRNVAFRYSAPDSEACRKQMAMKSRLADPEIGNSELAAIAADRKQGGDLDRALTCMLQEHYIKVDPAARWPNGKKMDDLRYRLAFIEFTQEGQPAELGSDGQLLAQAQMDALLKHLESQAQDQNYVMVFIHGWRHDARIGDDNVQNLRIYAAYAASFLDYRCKMANRYCGAKLTAVYVGWRGARIDERFWSDLLGESVGSWVGTVLASPTLFDRKPISERIGPAAVAGLQRIHKSLIQFDAGRNANEGTRNRMITFGHSLGGNMLAGTLKETMVDKIRRHLPGAVIESPIGDLIVLLNPASEAENWTAIQREMREKVVFATVNETPDTGQLVAGHQFFSNEQPPIYVSLTSAYLWPVGGLRQADLPVLNVTTINEIYGKRNEFEQRVDYDWATHDLFPTFKGDLRPVAETLERKAEQYRGSADRCPTEACEQKRSVDLECRYFVECLLRGVAAFARNFPFMNTNNENSRTIGHLDPLRPPFGAIRPANYAATSYGTTHEFIMNQNPGHGTSYQDAADPYRSECAIVDHWLWNARLREGGHGNAWDSGYSRGTSAPGGPPNLTPVRPRATIPDGHVESQFRHGYLHGGMQPITRANDPFWNVRAFDTAMKRHDGYVSYPLMCAIHQLVLDDIASPMPAPAASAGR